MRTTLICRAVMSATLALVAPAAAETAPGATWSVDAGTQFRWWNSESAAAIAPGSMTGTQILVGRHLTRFTARGGLDLGAFVRLGGGSASGQLFQTLETHIDQTTITGGVRLDARLWRQLHLVGLVELGAAHTSVTIGDELGAMAPVDDAAWSYAAYSTVGLEFVALRRRVHLAVRIEAGLAMMQDIALTAYPRTRPDDELSIPTVYAGLGDLDTSGRTLGFSVRGGF